MQQVKTREGCDDKRGRKNKSKLQGGRPSQTWKFDLKNRDFGKKITWEEKNTGLGAEQQEQGAIKSIDRELSSSASQNA